MASRSLETRGARALGFALLAAGLACGGDPEPMPEVGHRAPAEAPVETADELANEPPVLESVHLVPSDPAAGTRVRAQVEASDPDGDAFQLFYEWRLDGEKTAERGDTFEIPAEGASEVEVWVTARDAGGAGDPASARASVANQPPEIAGVVIEPAGEVTVARDLLASPRASDPEGDEISYRYTWKVNGRRAGDAESLPSRAFQRGDRIDLSVVASDGNGESEPFEIEPISVANSPPAITSRPGGFDGDRVLRYQVTASDPDGDRRFRYELVGGPEGMRLDRVTGELSWSPREDQSGSHSVEIEVSDGQGGKAAQAFEVSVAVRDEASEPAAPAPAEEEE